VTERTLLKCVVLLFVDSSNQTRVIIPKLSNKLSRHAFKIVKLKTIETKNHSHIFETKEFSKKLHEWLEGELSCIENDCSLVILTILCHGIHGHLSHEVGGEWGMPMEIEKLFELFKKIGGLKGIPKVSKIFAC